jgi:outer membrane lipoprotein SlyB
MMALPRRQTVRYSLLCATLFGVLGCIAAVGVADGRSPALAFVGAYLGAILGAILGGTKDILDAIKQREQVTRWSTTKDHEGRFEDATQAVDSRIKR